MVLPKSLMRRRRQRLLLLLAIGNSLILNVLCSPNEKGAQHPYGSTSGALSRSIFGVRGGAFFGLGKSSRSKGGGDGDGDGNPKRYPALSIEEIEDKLNVPVFGLTDEKGQGIILSSGDDNIFHFFFSRHMADAALKAVIATNADAPKMKVSAFHLGKCWFKFITNSETRFQLTRYRKDANSGPSQLSPSSQQVVHFRLVPNTKDLMGARILTGLKPNEMDQLKEAVESPDTPKAMEIMQKAAHSASGFESPFNHIPVFAIAQMRVRQKDGEGNATGQAMLPMHLSSKTMSDTWREFIHTSPQFAHAEATLQLVELHKMIDMMQRESDFDFRNIVFVMPSYDKDGPNNELDDSDDDDSDDSGGGGDNGMNAGYNEISVEPFFEPYVLETFVDTPSETPVQL